jgi:hypothetical protein
MWHVWEGERCILEGKRSLGRPRRRWEYNIKIDLQETGLGAWNAFV